MAKYVVLVLGEAKILEIEAFEITETGATLQLLRRRLAAAGMLIEGDAFLSSGTTPVPVSTETTVKIDTACSKAAELNFVTVLRGAKTTITLVKGKSKSSLKVDPRQSLAELRATLEKEGLIVPSDKFQTTAGGRVLAAQEAERRVADTIDDKNSLTVVSERWD